MLKLVAVLSCLCGAAFARGAGRAFPIDSENYAIDEFQRINRYIEWDETNFLVDLSGQYANCDNIGRNGFLDVQKQTPEGQTIAAYVDDTYGDASDVNSVNTYIRKVLDTWTDSYSEVYQQINAADRFGCSVRPGCRGSVSVACVFSPASRGGGFRPPNIEIGGEVNSQAFTEEQYDLAEKITGNQWNRDHTLENMSGMDISCAMIFDKDMRFPQAEAIASQRGISLTPQFGAARNRGETEPAMVEVLKSMKELYGVKGVGCSLIPDCMIGEGPGAEMFVVVACLYA